MTDELVVVDCCRRFDGGGDTSFPLELGRLLRLGRVDIVQFVLLPVWVHGDEG